MTDRSRVLVEITDRVATVTLDDPKRRNALDLALCDEIVATFDRLETSGDVGAIVVTGAAPAFCAGADLSHLGDAAEEGLRAVLAKRKCRSAFKLRKATFKGRGLQAPLTEASWEHIRDMAYEDRGA